jgi:glycolate oxidase iron-sulfur subunit
MKGYSGIRLDPRAYSRGLSCVHCGLCLPACPTYTETGNEADSPRGRIQLMLGLADRRIDLTPAVQHHLDLCLDCRACETACPSGVVYHELIEDFRSRTAHLAARSAQNRLLRFIMLHVLTHPTRLKLAMLPARLLQKMGAYQLLRRMGFFRLLPATFQKMERMLPPGGSVWPRSLRGPQSTSGAKGKVGFFEGCIGSVMCQTVNEQAAQLLSTSGAAVAVPRRQVCCGAIHHHNGEHDSAAALARRNIDAFAASGHIVTTIAGCGAMLREYDVLLRDDPAYAQRAGEFSARVRDISEMLLELGLPDLPHRVEQTATYHDACHLAHAQRVTSAPRELLDRIKGLKLVPLPESDMCCGAAGTYNLQHPEMAARLADRKLQCIASTRTDLCVAGNVGCAMHIQSQADVTAQPLRVVHPVQLLHAAMFGGSVSAGGRS